MQRADPDRPPRPRKPRPRRQIGAGADRGDALSRLGAVLAGGASSRFGSDKALALLEGRPLIAHAHEAIAGAVDTMIVCGREWGALVSVADVPAAGLGPLGGIAGALRYAAAEGFVSVLTISCDMPEVPEGLLDALLERSPSYCPDAPVLGHWPVKLAEQLTAYLASCAPAKAGTQTGLPPLREHNRALSVRAWAQAIGANAIPAPTPLRNINRPPDLLA